ncbi:hypothetical protein [Methylobacterium sp. J-077]|uniref:hypothetical protein n=1 Tax=Methylobacterium sp. J-077 TaxID=2836656 RepID=UPI001FB87D5F|nr:hypothetical protein [Methylobacterium sp. J-077]MCJ2124168.1 hypothetical protein [Methylobacterium sp. J-077]
MGDDVTALLVAIARENAELRQQLATAQDMLMESAIDAGNLHALIEAVQAERDAWREEAEARPSSSRGLQRPNTPLRGGANTSLGGAG